MNSDQATDVFLSEAKPQDSHTYGLVRAINEDSSYQVQLNKSSTLTRCANFCTANVGDLVKVVINANGKCDAIGRLGGEIGGGGAGVDWVEDFGEDGIWTWVKYASGRAECWGEWIGSYESQIAADGYGYVDVPLPAIFAEREPAHITPSYQAYRIDKVYDNAEQMNDEGELVANVDYVRMLIWADGSSIPTTAEFSFSLSVKGLWKELERPSGGGSGGGAVTYSQGDVSDWIAGKVFPYAGTNEPIGCLLCDGRAVSRREYWELFDAIGTTYGAGDGSSTFNLPNIESRTIIGESDVYALGAVGGEEKHTLTVDEMPNHPGHLEGNNGISSLGNNTRYLAESTLGTYGSTARGWYDVSNEIYPAGCSRGGDQPHNNMQPYIVMRYFITTGKGDPVSGINPADYVAERLWWTNPNSASDVYVVEKWASGYCRASGRVKCTSEIKPTTGQWGYGYYASLSGWAIPPFFKEITNLNIEVDPNVSGVGFYSGSPRTIDLDAGTFTWYLWAPNNTASIKPTVYITFEGKWKDSPASGGTETIAPTIAERFEGIEADLLDMRKNKLLWSGGAYMTADQTATLSEAISEQESGVLLVWSGYYSGNAQNYDWISTFVPKYHVQEHNGAGVCCYGLCSDGQMMKYVYVSDTKIEGHSSGTDTGTYGGVTRANNKYVLRYVLGV